MKVFDDNLQLLKDIFGEKTVLEKIERLKFIFDNTEKAWQKNLELFREHEVKYILICEAPPYSETDEPVYFYNQTDRKLNKTIWKVFFNGDKQPKSNSEYYKKLAQQGFLLIDNLPFSMSYGSNHRKKAAYLNLIQNSLDWFFSNIKNSNVKISNEVKIAFGFKLNAIKFIEATAGKINIGDLAFNFNENNIGADGSGFPNSVKISKIFFSSENIEYSDYNYYKGEAKNPYIEKDGSVLDFSNPKSLFWYYEQYHFVAGKKKDFKPFIENLIRNKLSEYHRSDYELWEMYFTNSIK